MPIDYINRECGGCNFACDLYTDFYDTLPLVILDENEIQECLTFMRNCPCATCLVKVTCRVVCDPYCKYAMKNRPSIYKDTIQRKKAAKLKKLSGF